jgi:hypothetical protein
VALASSLLGQAPVIPHEVQGLPPRAAAVDYQAQKQAGKITIAAEFTGHGIPNSGEALNSEDYVAVEVAVFGAAGEHMTITATEFWLRIDGKKEALQSQNWGLVAREIRDPEWVSPEAAEGAKSKGGVSSSGGNREAGTPAPLPPKPPIELLRNWQQRVRRAAIAEGDRALPQAGLLFFRHRGKRENIKSVELIYDGSAGKATLKLL